MCSSILLPTPTASPGLPVSPTALPGSGASTYNFCSPPQMSPMKNMRSGSKATKPVPLGTASSELAPFPQFNYPMFAGVWVLLYACMCGC